MEKILDGKKLAETLNLELKSKIDKWTKKTRIRPKLVTILVGKDPASKIYIDLKHKTCAKVGIESEMIKLEENASKNDLKKEIEKLNNDPKIHGILLQIPLPTKLRNDTSEILNFISPNKDVDCCQSINKGKLFDYDEELTPCTPKGIITLLEYYGVHLKGKDVVIVNRSNLVGKPLIFMFLKRDATVSICHTSTNNIDSYLKKADILVIAVGRPNFLTKDKIKEGAVIIDVGINRINGKIVGDTDFQNLIEKCGKITPVPGGVGPMTICILMQNTFTLYRKQIKIN
jgi:methylenetetrahydrofolate dehydrogenase (NADP+)/methenyltetrahydrofolate cyclohydrolase